VECGYGKRKAITAISVVPNPGHTMVSREDIARLLIAIESRDELLGFTDDMIDDADVVHVFLSWRMRCPITHQIVWTYDTFEWGL
jgi:hypothetical protein